MHIYVKIMDGVMPFHKDDDVWDCLVLHVCKLFHIYEIWFSTHFLTDLISRKVTKTFLIVVNTKLLPWLLLLVEVSSWAFGAAFLLISHSHTPHLACFILLKTQSNPRLDGNHVVDFSVSFLYSLLSVLYLIVLNMQKGCKFMLLTYLHLFSFLCVCLLGGGVFFIKKIINDVLAFFFLLLFLEDTIYQV